MPRSRSTTSAARRARRNATTTSSTCRTYSRRAPTGCRWTSARASSIFATRGAPPSSRSGSASAAGTRGSRQPRATSLAGAIGFYGRPGPGNDGTPGPIQRAGEFAAPILALQGGDDPGIPNEESEAFDAALDAAGVEHEVVIYPGAPHSFFDRKYEEFAGDSDDAWARVLAFLERYS